MTTQKQDSVKCYFISRFLYLLKVLPYVDGWVRHSAPVVVPRSGSNKEKGFEMRPLLATSTKINQPSSRRRMENGKRVCDCRGEEKEKRNYFSGFDFLVPDLEDEYSSRIMKRNQNRLIVAN